MTTPPSRPASLGRRALPALALTGASGVLFFALDRPSAAVHLAAPPAGAATPGAAGRSVDAPTVPPTGGTGPAASTAAPGVTTTVPAVPTCTGETHTGPTVATRFGPVQVQATVSADGTICDVQALQYPNGDRRSMRINQQAIPLLHDWTLYSQSAGFDSIGGATITSRAYKSSLQAILDGVHG